MTERDEEITIRTVDDTSQEEIDAIESIATVIVNESDTPEDLAEMQAENEEQLQELAYTVLKRAVSLGYVKVDRGKFLRTELGKYCPESQVRRAVDTTPALANVPEDVVEKIARDSIAFEATKVTCISAAAGLPGGFAMAATVPADLAQYFAHALRIEQKLAYIYGWKSFLGESDEIDDETMGELILFLGVMMNVSEAAKALQKFAAGQAMPAVAKKVAAQPLMKHAWYPAMKKVLGVVGIHMNRELFGKAVSKAIPVVGGVVSGALTFATFKPGASRLRKKLRELPQARGGIEDLPVA